MLKYIYLIQGQAERITNYFHLANRVNCKAYFLTYDKEVKECTYFPGSSWAEGRNLLLDKIEHEDYDYLIMLDDDVEFSTGEWTDFEKALAKYKPAVGVPLVSKVKRSTITEDGKPWEIQNFRINDEQCIAFHSTVVKDRILLPYVTEFDNISWWATCEIQQLLIQTIYSREAIQFNEIKVDNLIHGRHDSTDKSYKSLIREWLSNELNIAIKEIWHYWEDWPGVHFAFDLDKYKSTKRPVHSKYETNFNLIIDTTTQFLERSSQNKAVDYSIKADEKAKIFRTGSGYR